MRVKFAVAFVVALFMAIAFATSEPELSMGLQASSSDVMALNGDSYALAESYDTSLVETDAELEGSESVTVEQDRRRRRRGGRRRRGRRGAMKAKLRHQLKKVVARIRVVSKKLATSRRTKNRALSRKLAAQLHKLKRRASHIRRRVSGKKGVKARRAKQEALTKTFHHHNRRYVAFRRAARAAARRGDQKTRAAQNRKAIAERNARERIRRRANRIGGIVGAWMRRNWAIHDITRCHKKILRIQRGGRRGRGRRGGRRGRGRRGRGRRGGRRGRGRRGRKISAAGKRRIAALRKEVRRLTKVRNHWARVSHQWHVNRVRKVRKVLASLKAKGRIHTARYKRLHAELLHRTVPYLPLHMARRLRDVRNAIARLNRQSKAKTPQMRKLKNQEATILRYSRRRLASARIRNYRRTLAALKAQRRGRSAHAKQIRKKIAHERRVLRGGSKRLTPHERRRVAHLRNVLASLRRARKTRTARYRSVRRQYRALMAKARGGRAPTRYSAAQRKRVRALQAQRKNLARRRQTRTAAYRRVVAAIRRLYKAGRRNAWLHKRRQRINRRIAVLNKKLTRYVTLNQSQTPKAVKLRKRIARMRKSLNNPGRRPSGYASRVMKTIRRRLRTLRRQRRSRTPQYRKLRRRLAHIRRHGIRRPRGHGHKAIRRLQNYIGRLQRAGKGKSRQARNAARRINKIRRIGRKMAQAKKKGNLYVYTMLKRKLRDAGRSRKRMTLAQRVRHLSGVIQRLSNVIVRARSTGDKGKAVRLTRKVNRLRVIIAKLRRNSKMDKRFAVTTPLGRKAHLKGSHWKFDGKPSRSAQKVILDANSIASRLVAMAGSIKNADAINDLRAIESNILKARAATVTRAKSLRNARKNVIKARRQAAAHLKRSKTGSTASRRIWRARYIRSQRRARALAHRFRKQKSYLRSYLRRVNRETAKDQRVISVKKNMIRSKLPVDARSLLDRMLASYTSATVTMRDEVRNAIRRRPRRGGRRVAGAPSNQKTMGGDAFSADATNFDPRSANLINPNYKGMTAKQATHLFNRMREVNKFRDFSTAEVDKKLGTVAQVPSGI